MRLTKTLAAAAAISFAGVAANAGGLGDSLMESDVEMIVPMAVESDNGSLGSLGMLGAAGSLGSGTIVLGLLAALVAASGSF